MYREWSQSPALQVVFSVSAETPVLARQRFRRSSQGPAAASLLSGCAVGLEEAGVTTASVKRIVAADPAAARRHASTANTRLDAEGMPTETSGGARSCGPATS